jgi:hypothetical protein
MKIGEELPQVILDIKAVKAIDWKSAIVLHDDTFGKCKFYSIHLIFYPLFASFSRP